MRNQEKDTAKYFLKILVLPFVENLCMHKSKYLLKEDQKEL